MQITDLGNTTSVVTDYNGYPQQLIDNAIYKTRTVISSNTPKPTPLAKPIVTVIPYPGPIVYKIVISNITLNTLLNANGRPLDNLTTTTATYTRYTATANRFTNRSTWGNQQTPQYMCKGTRSQHISTKEHIDSHLIHNNQ